MLNFQRDNAEFSSQAHPYIPFAYDDFPERTTENCRSFTETNKKRIEILSGKNQAGSSSYNKLAN